jgi:hypothetical protein
MLNFVVYEPKFVNLHANFAGPGGVFSALVLIGSPK